MKLVATTTAIVAALSLFGCATENDGEGGAHLAGLRPAKPSIDDAEFAVTRLNPAIEQLLNGTTVRNPRGGNFVADAEITSETLKPPYPITGICEVCDVVVLRDRRVPEEYNVLDQAGEFFCRYWVEANGHIKNDGCW